MRDIAPIDIFSRSNFQRLASTGPDPKKCESKRTRTRSMKNVTAAFAWKFFGGGEFHAIATATPMLERAGLFASLRTATSFGSNFLALLERPTQPSLQGATDGLIFILTRRKSATAKIHQGELWLFPYLSLQLHAQCLIATFSSLNTLASIDHRVPFHFLRICRL